MTVVSTPLFPRATKGVAAEDRMEVDAAPDPPVTTAAAAPVPVPGLIAGQQPAAEQASTGAFRKPANRRFRPRQAGRAIEEDDEATQTNLSAFLAGRAQPAAARAPRPRTYLEILLESNFRLAANVFGAVMLEGCFNDVEHDFDARAVLAAVMHRSVQNEQSGRGLILFVGSARRRAVGWAALAQLAEADRLAEYAPDGLDLLVHQLQEFGAPAMVHYSRAELQSLEWGAVSVGQAYFTQRRRNQDGSVSGCHLAADWNTVSGSLRDVILLNSATIDGRAVQLFQYRCSAGLRRKTVFRDIDAGNALLWLARRLGVQQRLYQAGEWTVEAPIVDHATNGPLLVKVVFKGPGLVHIT